LKPAWRQILLGIKQFIQSLLRSTQPRRSMSRGRKQQEKRTVSSVFRGGTAGLRTVHNDIPFSPAHVPSPGCSTAFPQDHLEDWKLIRHHDRSCSCESSATSKSNSAIVHVLCKRVGGDRQASAIEPWASECVTTNCEPSVSIWPLANLKIPKCACLTFPWLSRVFFKPLNIFAEATQFRIAGLERLNAGVPINSSYPFHPPTPFKVEANCET